MKDSSDNELVAAYLEGDESAKTEIIARHRAACIDILAEKVGPAEAAECMVDAFFSDAPFSEYDPEGECLLAWLFAMMSARFASWFAPAYVAYTQLELEVAESRDPHKDADWLPGELEKRTTVAMRERVAQSPAVTDHVDALFAASTDHAATWEQLDAIRRRATELQAVLDDGYEYEDNDDYWNDDDDVEAA